MQPDNAPWAEAGPPKEHAVIPPTITPADILAFWFEQTEPAKWWTRDVTFDRQIAERFTDAHAAATRCELYAWRDSPTGRLAEVIVLDQFSRNLNRDSALAFANDPLALALAQEAIAAQADQALTPLQRSFLYLPFMHSESLPIHEIAVGLYERNGLANNLDFELRHKRIIERFGRYPHRNVAIGRVSTADELAFLQTPDSSF